MNKLFSLLFTALSFSASAQLIYIGELEMNGETPLRFNAIIKPFKNSVELNIINSQDTIKLVGKPIPGTQTWRFDFPVFNTHIRLRRLLKHWVGTFIDDDKGDTIPVVFKPASKETPRYNLSNMQAVENRFQITFEPGTSNERVAVLEYFPYTKSEIRGSILTTAGDYRFLQGSVSSDSLIMSTFDGKFAYVFVARLQGDSIFGYQFYTKANPRQFKGVKSNAARLPDPKALTQVKNDAGKIRFSLPDTEGKIVEFNANDPGAKLTFITIGGSWCPNCMDEARFLNQLYQKYNDRGVKIIGVYFEYTDKESVALPILKRMATQLKLEFPILYGGSVRQQAAARVFPQIQKVLAYPTLIALDAQGNILKTYTGFYGPGTSLFADYEREMIEWIEQVVGD
ncbi:hypothetical protein JCM31826_20110 [Thermaurantimonas aggregans]|uniref:Thioredoxin domain-containing protein n=1 Tax=Thermaurantimonas aggregans TaxID=2173829 RepID=A0A401XND9_9FLAO|nr:TlpA disulfide reductase family protein [Thermaurantimonas aggregans]GCD78529.1 hypothetical protein JCM31826_20110 [Thermaurantimonas aggregans]